MEAGIMPDARETKANEKVWLKGCQFVALSLCAAENLQTYSRSLDRGVSVSSMVTCCLFAFVDNIWSLTS